MTSGEEDLSSSVISHSLDKEVIEGYSKSDLLALLAGSDALRLQNAEIKIRLERKMAESSATISSLELQMEEIKMQLEIEKAESAAIRTSFEMLNAQKKEEQHEKLSDNREMIVKEIRLRMQVEKQEMEDRLKSEHRAEVYACIHITTQKTCVHSYTYIH